jgi:uncharacterized protein (TIGR02466 family)
MERYEYFTSNVYREELPEWVPYTRQVVRKYYDSTLDNGMLSQTSDLAKDKDLEFLTDYLLLASDTILREQGYNMDKYELYISSLWGQDVGCTGSTNVHLHKNSQLCGWFFLDTPSGGSYPIYYDPRSNKQMIELDYIQEVELSNASTQVHFNNLKPGTLLIANSWMQHQLTPNTSRNQTRSLHFIISHRERECNMY